VIECRIDYFDLAGLETEPADPNVAASERSAYATKKFSLEGVALHTDEFSAADRTLCRSTG